jgi:DNA end-binding protein Ku
MTPRANWKGYLKVAELACPVALYSAASPSERVALHVLNRATGHRVHRQYVDRETGKVVPAEAQAKGYEIADDEYVVLEPEDIAAAVPGSDKTLMIESFVACAEIDDLYLDRPYYLAPAGEAAEEAFGLLREGMREAQVAALGRALLFRRLRSLLIRVQGSGLIATTLKFDYEIKSAKEAFSDVPKVRVKGEMLSLAKHIIAQKRGRFEPSHFKDRYEAALVALVRDKLAGKPLQPRKQPAASNIVNLMEALRQSAGHGSKTRARSGGSTGTQARRQRATRHARSAPQRKKAG